MRDGEGVRKISLDHIYAWVGLVPHPALSGERV